MLSVTITTITYNGDIFPFMRGMLEKCKNLQYTQATVKILSALNAESQAQIEALANELCE